MIAAAPALARPSRTRLDATTLLTRLLAARAAAANVTWVVRDWRTRPWASATFVGERHEALVEVAGNATAFIASLPEADLPVRGHLVADLAVASVAPQLYRLTALVLVEA